jgi:hypothetical protein
MPLPFTDFLQARCAEGRNLLLHSDFLKAIRAIGGRSEKNGEKEYKFV